MNLKELICPKLILCDVDAKDFQDALRQMAGHLKKEGYVEEGYLDMLLERERKFPPDFVPNRLRWLCPIRSLTT